MTTTDDTLPLQVTEIFKSIQGESTWAGTPCVFVRLAGCPLRCLWCDTTYAYSGGESLTVGEITKRVQALDCPLVEITGGEPLAQKNCPALARALLRRGFQVLCETSGALPVDSLPPGVIRVMDIKCPGSGMANHNDWSNINHLRPELDEVKLVLASRADYEWARDVVRRYRLETRCRAVLMSAVHERVKPADLASWILEDGLPVRLQIQLHKLIWPPEMRGV